MKKMISSLLCVVMAAALFAGCGKASPDSEETGDTPSVGDTANDGDDIVRYTLTSTPQIDPGVGSDLGAATVLINLYGGHKFDITLRRLLLVIILGTNGMTQTKHKTVR